MKTYPLTLTFGMLTLATMLAVVPRNALAQNVPAAVNYQGKLIDNLGNSLATGYYEIEFRIWDDASSTTAASLVWGRSFPLHVVEGGLFNILLSNDGGQITTPGAPQFNDIRDAFGDEDRYLGLTITVGPSGNIATPLEISPRQRMASGPFAMQAQTANTVRDLSIITEALADQSVTGNKLGLASVGNTNLAAGAVTSSALANNSVTTAKIVNGAVTAAKLNIDGDLHLNNHTVYLRGDGDSNHGLKYASGFAGNNHDGPALFGYSSGVLGTTGGGEKAALTWDNNGLVNLFGTPVNLTTYLPTNTSGTHGKGVGSITLEFHVSGIFMYYTYASETTITILGADGINPVEDGTLYLGAANDDARGKLFTWPVSAGDRITLDCTQVHNFTLRNQVIVVPFGLAAPTDHGSIATVVN